MTQRWRTLTGVVTVESLGKALGQLRDAKHLSQDELAERAGMDKGNLSKLERGKLAPGKSGYSHESLGRLSEGLGTPLSQIYALAEAIENGVATPDTARLIVTMERLPEKSQGAIREVINTVAESTGVVTPAQESS